MFDYDLIIRNGTVVDGSGKPSKVADIAITAGYIARIEANMKATASHQIDASGQLVTPGFIDVHSHYDGQVSWDEHLAPSSRLGATTVVMGNCGVGFAPCRADDHDVLIDLMEGVEDIPGTALAEGLQWNWESFTDYLDAIDSKPKDIDVAALFPHSPLRVYVMGERALNREAATEADIESMQKLLAEGLTAGAVGFSTSRTRVHKTLAGSFIPSYKADAHELHQLGAVLDKNNGQVFQLISDFNDTEADDEFEILRHVCKDTGCKATFTLLQSDLSPTMWQQQLQRIDKAQAQGLDICGQVLSRPLGVLMGLNASMTLFSARPTFRRLDKLPLEERVKELSKPEIKARILAEEDINPSIFITGIRERGADMFAMEFPLDYLPSRSTSLAARAAVENRDADEYLYDWMLTNNGNSLVYIPMANFTDSIPEMLGHAHTMPGLGDGGAHVGTICDASSIIYILTHWVKECQAFSLEEGIYMMTRKAAEFYSLFDRGLLAEGMKADINIIDFDRLQLQSPHIVYDLPAGGKRFLQDADGLVATLVSGQVIYREGEFTGVLPGSLVRGKQQDPRAA